MEVTSKLPSESYLQCFPQSKELCNFDGEVISLPLDLCQNAELLCDILSLDTWDTIFTQAQRSHLETYLPQGNPAEKKYCLAKLLSGQNIRFGNPLLRFCEKLKHGHYNPLVVEMNSILKKTQMKNYRFAHKKYLNRLVSDILISHHKAVEKLPEDLRLKIQSHTNKPSVKSIHDRVLYRYFQETFLIRKKVDEPGFSSCDENYPGGPPAKLFCYDSTANDSVYTSFNISGSELNEDPQEKFSSKSQITELHPGKIKKYKHKSITSPKLEKQRLMDYLALSESNSDECSDKEFDIMKTHSELSPGTCEDLKNETHSCYFALLRDIFLSVCDQQLTIDMLQEGIRTWIESPVSSLNDWYYFQSDWVEILSKAITYLSGSRDGYLGEKKPHIKVCSPKSFKWIGSGNDSDSQLKSIFIRWMEMLKQCDDEFEPSLMAPAPRNLTPWKVRPSMPDEREKFQIQERERFYSPHRCYVYKMHGYEAVVGPVRGVTGSNLQSYGSKAREHSLLISNRPSFVTILTIVGDAVARLPNGEGTRSDICELLKDSQYLLENASDSTLNTVVSGALDRLQQGNDPSVKYDSSKKLWVYLYRDKRPEDFEVIVPIPPKVVRKSNPPPVVTEQEKVGMKTLTSPGTFITSPSSSGVIRSVSPTISHPQRLLHLENVSLNNLSFPVTKLSNVLSTASISLPNTPTVNTVRTLNHPPGKSILLQNISSTVNSADNKVSRSSVIQSHSSNLVSSSLTQAGGTGVQNSVKIIKVMAPNTKPSQTSSSPVLKTVVLTPTGENGNLKQVIVNSQAPGAPSLLRSSAPSQITNRGKLTTSMLQTVRLSRDKTGQIVQLPTPSCSTVTPVRLSLVSRPGAPLARLLNPRSNVSLASTVNKYQAVNRQPVFHVMGTSSNTLQNIVRVVTPNAVTATTASSEGVGYELCHKRSVNVMLDPRGLNANSAVVYPSPSVTIRPSVTLVPSNINQTIRQKVFTVRPNTVKTKISSHPRTLDPCQITQDETLAAIASISGHYQDDS